MACWRGVSPCPPRGGSPWRSLRRVGFTAPHRVVRMSLSRTLPTCPRQPPLPLSSTRPHNPGRSERTNRPFNCCSESVGLVVRPMPMLVVGLYGLALIYILIPNLCYFDGARRWSFDADPKVFQSNFVCFTPQSCLLCALRILGVQPQVTTRLQNASRPKSEPLRSNFARF